jgi:hypothetical protein
VSLAGLDITEIKTTPTKGTYAVTFKALPVAYVLDQLVQDTFKPSEVTIDSVTRPFWYLPSVPLSL